MNRNRKIFIISFVIFLAMVLLLLTDMANRTTAPWNRKKQLSRALDKDAAKFKKRGVIVDSAALKKEQSR